MISPISTLQFFFVYTRRKIISLLTLINFLPFCFNEPARLTCLQGMASTNWLLPEALKQSAKSDFNIMWLAWVLIKNWIQFLIVRRERLVENAMVVSSQITRKQKQTSWQDVKYSGVSHLQHKGGIAECLSVNYHLNRWVGLVEYA